jgi:hypothetical protein
LFVLQHAHNNSVGGKCSGWLPVIALPGVFLVGFVPMWIKSSRLNAELFRTERQARVQQIQTPELTRRCRPARPWD